MNPVIVQHFDFIEEKLIQSPIVEFYFTMRKDISPEDGKIRIKAILSNGDALELFEYVTESFGCIVPGKYSYHWQDNKGKIKRRWDNAPHHPRLQNAPHHLHTEKEKIIAVSNIPTFLDILQEIETGVA